MNDTTELQGLIDAAIISGAVVSLTPKREYNITLPLMVNGSVRIHGNHAIIVAAAPMDAVLMVSNSNLELSRVILHGGRNAKSCLTLFRSSWSRFKLVTFMRALQDGVLNLEASGACTYEQCAFRHNGITYTEGTVQVDAGRNTVHGIGTCFTKVRQFDHICIGGQWLQVRSVHSDTELTLSLYPSVVDSHPAGTPYHVHIGDGYREELSSDSNINAFTDCLFRGNAGSGASFHGLYGPRVTRAQNDFNEAFGFSIGMASGSNVIVSSFRDSYTEGNAAKSFFLGYAIGVTIDTLNCGDYPEPWIMSNPSFNVGIMQGVQGTGGSIRSIGDSPLCELPASRVATQGTPYTGAAPTGVLKTSSPMGQIVFNYTPLPGQPIGWVKSAANPTAEWFPFGEVYQS